jgi:hypothetical protein
VSTFFGELQGSYVVTAIPSSKVNTDPLYDRRFEDFFTQLKNFCLRIDVVLPLEAIDKVVSVENKEKRHFISLSADSESKTLRPAPHGRFLMTLSL